MSQTKRTTTVYALTRFAVNHDRTWRDRLGSALRILASRIDGRRSLAIEIASEPAIGSATEAAIIKRALETAQDVHTDLVRAEAGEIGLSRLWPELWRESEQ